MAVTGWVLQSRHRSKAGGTRCLLGVDSCDSKGQEAELAEEGIELITDLGQPRGESQRVFSISVPHRAKMTRPLYPHLTLSPSVGGHCIGKGCALQPRQTSRKLTAETCVLTGFLPWAASPSLNGDLWDTSTSPRSPPR